MNYAIGHYLGPKVFNPRSRFFNPEHLSKTHAFYEKYGGKTIIIARFVPIVRTFAPFVAGIGAMSYARFIVYNVVGGVLWVAVCLGAGYLFGNLPFVKKNFSLVILGDHRRLAAAGARRVPAAPRRGAARRGGVASAARPRPARARARASPSRPGRSLRARARSCRRAAALRVR